MTTDDILTEKISLVKQWLESAPPVSIYSFCQKWVPFFYSISPEDRNYKFACMTLIKEIFRCTERTAYNWLAGSRNVPTYVERSLGYLDRYLEIRRLIY